MSSVKVSGSIKATPVEVVSPGMAPRPTPTKTPMVSHIKVFQLSTRDNASMNASG
ncbi:hypothetical protein [Halomonas sp. BC04]|uniref:hypothetical protein n=1 Tax=Halomonas sp. BC04 TaxID=1403540 RepID=UPI0003ED7693|nr:hypothetical protein [Halomonas sp. BC04]EWG97972.1 hypothetical protein Q427_33105 [Halomonas sp. BC04]